MIIICDNCNRVMDYEPYFKSYICRQCGRKAPVEKVVYRTKFPIKKDSVNLSSAAPLKASR